MNKNIIKKFKAAVLREVSKPLSIETISNNELSSGQVLVEMRYAGVCRSQLMEIDGERDNEKWIPHLLGHEGSGIVKALGKDVTRFQVNDRVVLSWLSMKGCESENAFYSSCSDGSKINSGKVTVFSQYTVVSENRLFKLPQEYPLDEGVLFGCALATGGGIIINEANIKPREGIAILGAGGIGLSALITLKAIGNNKTIVLDVNKDKLNFAKKFDNTIAIDISNPDWQTQFYKEFPLGSDLCIEAAGSCETIELGLQLIKKKGRLIFASHPEKGKKINIDPHELISGKRIHGSWGGNSNPEQLALFLLPYYRSGKLDLKGLLGNEYLLEEINLSFSELRKNNEFRPLIRFSR